MADDKKNELKTPWLNAGQSEQSRYERLITYFTDLAPDYDTNFNISEFESRWAEVKNHDLTPAELTTILSRSTAFIDRQEEVHTRQDAAAIVKRYFKDWEKQAVQKLEEFEQADLGLCNWSYRVLDVDPGKAFLSKWYKFASPLDILRAPPTQTQFVRSIVSCAVARLKPSENYFNLWVPKAVANMPAFSPPQHAFSLWAYARLATVPTAEFLEPWATQLDTLMEDPQTPYPTRYRANALGACGALYAISGDQQFASFAKRINRGLKLTDCTKQETRQVSHARIGMGLGGKIYIPQNSDRVHPAETRLTEIFVEAGFSVDEEKTVLALTQQKPDISFTEGEKQFLIERDGRQHFLNTINETTGRMDMAGFDGRTLYQTALMRIAAPDAHIIRIPRYSATAIVKSDPKEQKTLLSGLMEQAANQGPGAYYVRQRMAGRMDLKPMKIANAGGMDLG